MALVESSEAPKASLNNDKARHGHAYSKLTLNRARDSTFQNHIPHIINRELIMLGDMQ
jgi:hypothetical protein